MAGISPKRLASSLSRRNAAVKFASINGESCAFSARLAYAEASVAYFSGELAHSSKTAVRFRASELQAAAFTRVVTTRCTIAGYRRSNSAETASLPALPML